MKKLLLTTGILALSIMAFGVEENEADGRIRETGVVDVRARVVQPLKINTTALDYGAIVPGETKWGEIAGNVEVIGAAGEMIKFEVKDFGSEGQGKYVAYNGARQIYPVEMKTGSGENANEKMTADITLFEIGGGQNESNYANGMIKLPENGILNFRVDGPLTAGNNQKVGNYTGKIYVRAMYQ